MNPFRVWLALVACLIAHAGIQTAAGADITRTQTVQLRAGWNAVFLEVHPSETEPAVIFANTPVDIAASYYAPSSSAQFMTDPGVDLFKQAGWGVWYATDRPDAFLKTLHAIYGQQAYLIHTKSDFTWAVTGTVAISELTWQPNAYNFVGFCLSAQSPPTFAQFFGTSSAHRHNKIYRLVNGTWLRVSAPDGAMMRAGEAFWIYSQGNSTFQGPLRVETFTRQGLVLGARFASLTLRNQTDHPVTPTVEHVTAGDNAVPMSMVIQAFIVSEGAVQSVAARQPDGPWTQALPPLESGASVRVPLEARLQDMRSLMHQSLLKITTDLGTECWIPVVAIRPDLEEK